MSGRDGLLYRKLWPTDSQALESHLLRLDSADRRLRLGGAASDERISAYCGAINHARSILLGAFAGKQLRAVAELVLLDFGFPGRAELALTVEKPFQNQGVGTELAARALTIARNRFLSAVHLLCLMENRPMQRIAKKVGAQLSYRDGEVEGFIEPPWPDYLSFIEEAASEGEAFFQGSYRIAPDPAGD